MGLLRLAATAHSRGVCPSIATVSWQYRTLGTRTDNARPTRKNEDDESSQRQIMGEVLYSRAPSRAMLPRGLLAMTTVHTSYWLWYVLDFTPSLNAAAAKKNELLAATAGSTATTAETFAGIDPTIGYLGLGMAIMMSLGSAAFPKYLISEIREEGKGGALRVGVHSLPFCTPQMGAQAQVYPPAGVVIDSTADASAIFTRNNGDLTKSRGFLALRATGKRANLLLNISAEDTMSRPDALFEYILPSEMKMAGGNHSTTSGRKKRRKPMDPRERQQREQRQLRRRQ